MRRRIMHTQRTQRTSAGAVANMSAQRRIAVPVSALLVFLCLVPLIAASAGAQQSFAGVWRAGNDPYYRWVGSNWDDFNKKWEELSKQNLRLVDVETYMDGGQRRFAGVWRAGNDAHYLWVGANWNDFTKKWEELGKQNLRLTVLKTYTEGSERRFIGVWRQGNDAYYLWVGAGWNDFVKKWEDISKQNLRLVDLETYEEGGQRKFAGVWRDGSDAHYLWVGANWNDFRKKWEDLGKQNLRLTAIRTYVEGNDRKYIGVWRQGNDGYYLWAGADFENLKAKWHELAGQNLRLIKLVTYPGCSSDCANQVVAKSAYDYGITGDNTGYHWPVDTDPATGEKYARLSALEFSAAPFTLPFSDTSVKRWNGWLYGPGSWHHAVDYAIDLNQSFKVEAAADGKVIFIGWDSWSGNTIVVSHDFGGVQDAFRTIYMHIRNRPAHDCATGWSVTLPPLRRAR